MKKLATRLVDATLIPLFGYILRRLTVSPNSVVCETIRRAVADSADYADSHMPQALCFSNIEALWRHAFAARAEGGLVVEFGVWRGRSISFFASLTKEMIYGFDSFEGLREDWKGWELPKGMFNLGGVPPTVPANVTLIKGWFDETLQSFLREHPEPFSFVHIDCDTYEASSIVLSTAHEHFRKGTVVVFDEYFGYRGWRTGEFKAWQQFVAARGVSYEYLAFHDQIVSLIVT
jgi:Methyltransferase domain